jgi:hypothetical protein
VTGSHNVVLAGKARTRQVLAGLDGLPRPGRDHELVPELGHAGRTRAYF